MRLRRLRESSSCASGTRRWRGWWCFEPCVAFGHHAVEADADAFYDSEENRAADSTVPHSTEAAADCERAAGEPSRDDWVPRIFFAAEALDGTVVRRE